MFGKRERALGVHGRFRALAFFILRGGARRELRVRLSVQRGICSLANLIERLSPLQFLLQACNLTTNRKAWRRGEFPNPNNPSGCQLFLHKGLSESEAHRA